MARRQLARDLASWLMAALALPRRLVESPRMAAERRTVRASQMPKGQESLQEARPLAATRLPQLSGETQRAPRRWPAAASRPRRWPAAMALTAAHQRRAA